MAHRPWTYRGCTLEASATAPTELRFRAFVEAVWLVAPTMAELLSLIDGKLDMEA